MGQQQLLLLVLGIVIVGLAVVVGIQAFGENQKKANADAMVNDGVRIASDAQAWKLKPAAFGGGADKELSDATLLQLGYEDPYSNLNAGYTLGGSGNCLLITGTEESDDATANVNTVYVKVTGTTPSAIETAVNPATALAC